MNIKNESRDQYIVRKLREEKDLKESALDKQVDGKHYKNCVIQPVEYIEKNNLSFCEGNIVKYVTRHRTKGEGRKDIEKVIHYAEMILDLYYKEKKVLW
jgi:hypothetical protein|tara:strand:+ start:2061 stop:2357 length:297 start_codon:yes stop_codon:yes gene_type:complete